MLPCEYKSLKLLIIVRCLKILQMQKSFKKFGGHSNQNMATEDELNLFHSRYSHVEPCRHFSLEFILPK